MANISDAYGTVTIKAATKGLFKDILKSYKMGQQDAYYKTTIKFASLQEAMKSIIFNEDTEQFELKLPFEGNGCWSFKNNINEFIPKLFNYDGSKKLSTHSFEVEFDFQDAEPGCNFVYEATIRVGYNAGEEKIYKETLDESDDVDFTASNLIIFGFYKEWEVVDSDYLLQNREAAIEKLTSTLEGTENPDYLEFLANPDIFFAFVKKANDVGVWYSFEDWLDEAMLAAA